MGVYHTFYADFFGCLDVWFFQSVCNVLRYKPVAGGWRGRGVVGEARMEGCGWGARCCWGESGGDAGDALAVGAGDKKASGEKRRWLEV